MKEASCIELADAVCGGRRVDRAVALSIHDTPDRDVLQLLAVLQG